MIPNLWPLITSKAQEQVQILYDVHDGLDDDAKWAKSNLAMEQGPGKRGTRGLLLKKLLFKLLIG